MREGWKMVKLGEVCDRFGEYGMSVSSKPYDGIRYIRITDITDDGNLNDDYVSADINYIDDDYRLQKGDVLFARTGATVGKTLVYKEEFGECVYAGYLIRYRPNLSLVLPQFLFYCTHYQEYYNWVKNNQKAAAQPNISAKLYNGYEFPLPPLEEQHHIVSILDASFEKIDALKKNAEENLKNAKALFQQVLAQELKPKEGWVEKKLTEISENLDYKRVPITKNVRKSGKFPYYGASGIVDYVNDYLYDEDLLLISEDGANLLARTTPIAFSVSGKIWVNNHAHVLSFNNLTLQKFVEYFIAGFNITPYVTGMAQPKLNQKALEKIIISFPTDIEEQHRIVQTLDTLSEKCRRLEQVAQQTIRECDALKQSILRQAFSGEL